MHTGFSSEDIWGWLFIRTYEDGCLLGHIGMGVYIDKWGYMYVRAHGDRCQKEHTGTANYKDVFSHA